MALDRKEDSIFETIVGALDEMGAAFSSASDLEKAIWSATSLDATAAAKRDMVQIAAATHNTYVVVVPQLVAPFHITQILLMRSWGN